MCVCLPVRLTCDGGLLAVSAGIEAVDEALDGVGLADSALASVSASSFKNSKVRTFLIATIRPPKPPRA